MYCVEYQMKDWYGGGTERLELIGPLVKKKKKNVDRE